ncbi:LamG domain-containing protein [Variovorax paradoxus]|uniref:LamG domain-containing protein n=1 Tax=Variovorax paradoxus TaxID=34073 RepID=A0A6I6HJA2_VARPD|nr:LamG domain-containing protein [Variovorax paradoxus]QGW82927.1 hypothetical protein GOQ09_15685 [Variovorax paradoxus]
MATTYAPVALLHLDGPNASTNVVDAMHNLWQASDGAKLTTADSKFGGSCLSLDGSGDFITTQGGQSFVFGTGDFTVEAWVKPTNTGRAMQVVDFYQTNQASWQMEVNAAGRLHFYGWNGITTASLVTGTSSLYGAWHHVAISRKAGTIYACVDGVVEASVANAVNFSNQVGQLAIGAQVSMRNAAYDYAGLIDEVRITRGTGWYSANFTPPSAPFPDEAVILIGQQRYALAVGQPAAAYSGARPLFAGRLYRNFQILGAEGRLVGTVKEKSLPANLPLKRRVRLVRERDGATVGETWSDATTGAYVFTNIDAAEAYSVVTYDYLHNYRAVIADNLSVASGGVELVP